MGTYNSLIHFLGVGSSENPCSETYAGPHAASEPEVQAIQRFLTNKTLPFEVFVTLHSYGQLWMLPYGYSSEKAANHDNMVSLTHVTPNLRLK